MSRLTKWESEYFYGNKISDYGLENGYIDYSTLSKAFDCVMANSLREELEGKGFYFDLVSGLVDNSEEIDELERQIEELANEIVDLEYQIEELEDEHEKANYENKARISEELEGLYDKKVNLENEQEELENEKSELEDEEGYPTCDIFQEFIVGDRGAEILEEFGELVFKCEELDLNIWGVTHWGTSWDYVLTNVKLELDENN